jgi:hypothetical protein
MLHVHQQHRKRTLAQVFLGRPEDPALLRALRVAGSVVLLLLLAAALTRLLVHVGLLPEWLPFSWSGLGEELLVKSAGAFVVVLFLHMLRWLIRAGLRRLALTLVAATGPLFFCLGVMSFGAAQVFSRDVLATRRSLLGLCCYSYPRFSAGSSSGWSPYGFGPMHETPNPLPQKSDPKETTWAWRKKPPDRRSIQVEVEVPGTPEEVWQAIATGPGISAWEVDRQGGRHADERQTQVLGDGPARHLDLINDEGIDARVADRGRSVPEEHHRLLSDSAQRAPHGGEALEPAELLIPRPEGAEGEVLPADLAELQARRPDRSLEVGDLEVDHFMAPWLEPPPQGRERIVVARRRITQDADPTPGSSLPRW